MSKFVLKIASVMCLLTVSTMGLALRASAEGERAWNGDKVAAIAVDKRTSCVFSTTDTRRSYNYAPTALRVPFRRGRAVGVCAVERRWTHESDVHPRGGRAMMALATGGGHDRK